MQPNRQTPAREKRWCELQAGIDINAHTSLKSALDGLGAINTSNIIHGCPRRSRRVANYVDDNLATAIAGLGVNPSFDDQMSAENIACYREWTGHNDQPAQAQFTAAKGVQSSVRFAEMGLESGDGDDEDDHDHVSAKVKKRPANKSAARYKAARLARWKDELLMGDMEPEFDFNAPLSASESFTELAPMPLSHATTDTPFNKKQALPGIRLGMDNSSRDSSIGGGNRVSAPTSPNAKSFSPPKQLGKRVRSWQHRREREQLKINRQRADVSMTDAQSHQSLDKIIVKSNGQLRQKSLLQGRLDCGVKLNRCEQKLLVKYDKGAQADTVTDRIAHNQAAAEIAVHKVSRFVVAQRGLSKAQEDKRTRLQSRVDDGEKLTVNENRFLYYYNCMARGSQQAQHQDNQQASKREGDARRLAQLKEWKERGPLELTEIQHQILIRFEALVSQGRFADADAQLDLEHALRLDMSPPKPATNNVEMMKVSDPIKSRSPSPTGFQAQQGNGGIRLDFSNVPRLQQSNLLQQYIANNTAEDLDLRTIDDSGEMDVEME